MYSRNVYSTLHMRN